MNRRAFIRSATGALLVPAFPAIVRAITPQQRAAVLAARPKAPVVAGGGSEFSYNSVVFDGSNDYLLRGGDPVPDSKVGLLSVWVKMGSGSNDETAYYLMGNAGNSFYARRTAAGAIQCAGGGLSGFVSSENVIKSTGWAHILASWDMTVVTRANIYINGSNASPSPSNTDTTFSYATGEWKIGDLVGGASKWNGSMCEFYFTDEYLDITDAGNRAKFISSGKPVDLGSNGSTPTGTQPRIYLKGSAASWGTNSGSGGNFTITGTLEDGGTDKP